MHIFKHSCIKRVEYYSSVSLVFASSKALRTISLIISLVYVFNADVFDRILNSKPRKNGEYCITDVVQEAAREGKGSTCIFDGEYFDCGSMSGYALANAYMGLTNSDSADSVRSRLKELMTKTAMQQIPEKNS